MRFVRAQIDSGGFMPQSRSTHPKVSVKTSRAISLWNFCAVENAAIASAHHGQEIVPGRQSRHRDYAQDDGHHPARLS
jgi:hypothetical protein